MGALQNFSARTNFRLGSFNLVNVGYEFENEQYLNRNLTGITAEDSSVDVTQRSNTLYVQDLLRFWGDKLQVMAGFRYQGFSLLDPKLSPSTNSPYQGIPFTAPPSAYHRGRVHCLPFSEFRDEATGPCREWLSGAFSLRKIWNVLQQFWIFCLWRSPTAAGSLDRL